MAGSGKSRNAPCFCGSGRKLKQCCQRSLKRVHTWTLPGTSCRWRFWKAHGPAAERFAGEVAEHVCSGERFWIARDPPDGTTWMIDQEAVTLLEVIDRLPGALYDWVIEQTFAALDGRLRPSEASPEVQALMRRDDDAILVDGQTFGEVRELLVELLRLVHASDAVAARLGLDDAGGQTQTALERVWASAAA